MLFGKIDQLPFFWKWRQVHTSTPRWSRTHEFHAKIIVGKYIVRDYNGHWVALCLSIFWDSLSQKIWVEHKVHRTRFSFLGSTPHWSLISETSNPEAVYLQCEHEEQRQDKQVQITWLKWAYFQREELKLVVPSNTAMWDSSERTFPFR